MDQSYSFDLYTLQKMKEIWWPIFCIFCKNSGITGARISIDKNGDSEGNYTVIAYKPFNYTLQGSSFVCDHYMIPVANFHPSELASKDPSLPVRVFIAILRLILQRFENSAKMLTFFITENQIFGHNWLGTVWSTEGWAQVRFQKWALYSVQLGVQVYDSGCLPGFRTHDCHCRGGQSLPEMENWARDWRAALENWQGWASASATIRRTYAVQGKVLALAFLWTIQ